MKPEFYCLPSRHQHLVSAARFTFGDFSAFHPGAELWKAHSGRTAAPNFSGLDSQEKWKCFLSWQKQACCVIRISTPMPLLIWRIVPCIRHVQSLEPAFLKLWVLVCQDFLDIPNIFMVGTVFCGVIQLFIWCVHTSIFKKMAMPACPLQVQ